MVHLGENCNCWDWGWRVEGGGLSPRLCLVVAREGLGLWWLRPLLSSAVRPEQSEERNWMRREENGRLSKWFSNWDVGWDHRGSRERLGGFSNCQTVDWLAAASHRNKIQISRRLRGNLLTLNIWSNINIITRLDQPQLYASRKLRKYRVADL